MNKTFTLMLIAMTMLTTGCDMLKETPQPLVINNALSAEEIAAGRLTPEVMWKMARVGDFAVSPNGEQVVFGLTSYNMAENKGVTTLWTKNVNGGEAQRITDHAANSVSPVWSANGERIYFLSDRSGSQQLWSAKPDGSDMSQLSHLEGDIENFGIAPSGNKIFYVQRVKVEERISAEIYPDLDKSKARVYDDLMVRHWNRWTDGSHLHIFVADFNGKKISDGRDIMPNEPWDSPMEPYYDGAEIAWNNSGTQLAYTCKKLTGTEYAVSTDSDIYLYDVASGETVNINKKGAAEGAKVFVGYDRYPVFSPDDTKIAFTSMARAGNESDKDRLFVYDIATDSFSDLTATFDYSAANIIWNGEGELYFIAPYWGTYQLCKVDLAGNVTLLTSGDHDLEHVDLNGGTMIASRTRQDHATELYTLDPATGEMGQLTDVNRQVYENIRMGAIEKRWVKTTDGKEMLTWVIYPPDFDPSKKYPTLLYCEGGPQSTVSQFWSYRWNFQLMAAQGYIVVAPNRRGTPSFGREWVDQISGDYSGQNIRDLLAAIDDVAKEPYVDSDRLGCVGASYGGYSSFYLAGVHQKRFKAFIAHCGIFDFESMYGETEELFFINNDYGGPYWSNDPTAQRSYANSPHELVQNWDTPILIITGLNDFRIPYTQSIEAHTAARLLGVPSRLVAFENEAHQVFKPQNSLVWNREFFGWLDKYVKNPR
jgi:dipeptidyl aminopeptidase/acylaminoacyl peptidase